MKRERSFSLYLATGILMMIRQAADRRKMSFNEYVVFALKVALRREFDPALPENTDLRFSTKEERAFRRAHLAEFFDKSWSLPP